MQGKFLLWPLATLIVTTAMPAQAQQRAKLFRIGYLSSVDPASETARATGIRLALGERGYIEGQTINVDYRYAAGKRERFAEVAAELVRLNVDLIIAAGGDLLVQAAKTTTTKVPIVMTGTGADPVEAGLVESLARPGGNVTGVTMLNKDLGGKRLELLKAAVPALTSVALLYNPTIPPNVVEAKELQPIGQRSLAVALRSMPARDEKDLERVFATLKTHRPDGLYVMQGPLMRASRKRILDFASSNRLPTMYSNREFVESGGLMYYGADLYDIYRRVAYYIDRILQGAKPADLPVEQPTKFEFVVNLKAAKQIGLTIPPNVLARADRVIK